MASSVIDSFSDKIDFFFGAADMVNAAIANTINALNLKFFILYRRLFLIQKVKAH